MLPGALTSLNNRFWTNVPCGVQVVSLKAFCVGRRDQYSSQVSYHGILCGIDMQRKYYHVDFIVFWVALIIEWE